MNIACKGCLGTAPTHTCESYDPAAARRGAAMVMRAAYSRGMAWKLSPATNRPALPVNGKRNEG